MNNNILTFTYVVSSIAIFIEISVVESQAVYSKDEMCDRNGYRILDEVRNVLYRNSRVELYAQLLADQNKILVEQNKLLERQVQLLRTNQELNGSKSGDSNPEFAVWIGIHYDEKEGKWMIFPDMIPLGKTFSDWAPNEPSGEYNGDREECGSLKEYLDYQWNDVYCSRNYPFICEQILSSN